MNQPGPLKSVPFPIWYPPWAAKWWRESCSCVWVELLWGVAVDWPGVWMFVGTQAVLGSGLPSQHCMQPVLDRRYLPSGDPLPFPPWPHVFKYLSALLFLGFFKAIQPRNSRVGIWTCDYWLVEPNFEPKPSSTAHTCTRSSCGRRM